MVPWNDLAAVEAALAHGDVAAILTEPAMTNIGIVLPETGFHDRPARAGDRYGAMLMIDETHTFSAGPGGATTAWGLEPDIFVIGKSDRRRHPLRRLRASSARSPTVIERAVAAGDADIIDVGGVGGTLAGNALSLAAMRATLDEVLTERGVRAHDRAGDDVHARASQTTLDELDVPWSISQLGARAEYRFARPAPRNGDDSAAAARRRPRRPTCTWRCPTAAS